MIRTNRKCSCCKHHKLIIIRDTTVCPVCDRAANWEGVNVK